MVLTVILLSTFHGSWNGFVHSVVSALTWIAALILGFAFAPTLATYIPLPSSDSSDSTLPHFVPTWISFGLIYILVFVLGSLIYHRVSKFVEKVGLTFADRSLGLSFGALRGFVLVSALMLMFESSWENNGWWEESVSATFFKKNKKDIDGIFDYTTDVVEDAISGGSGFQLSEE